MSVGHLRCEQAGLAEPLEECAPAPGVHVTPLAVAVQDALRSHAQHTQKYGIVIRWRQGQAAAPGGWDLITVRLLAWRGQGQPTVLLLTAPQTRTGETKIWLSCTISASKGCGRLPASLFAS